MTPILLLLHFGSALFSMIFGNILVLFPQPKHPRTQDEFKRKKQAPREPEHDSSIVISPAIAIFNPSNSQKV